MRRTLVVVLGLGACVSASAAAAVKHSVGFRMPTHNIACDLRFGQARCDIRHRTYTLPGRPKSCPHVVDFGQGLVVGKSGKGRIVCAGDTVYDPSFPVLPYGSTDRYGAFSCASNTDGVTCTNTRTGHGFFLSIQSYRLF